MSGEHGYRSEEEVARLQKIIDEKIDSVGELVIEAEKTRIALTKLKAEFEREDESAEVLAKRYEHDDVLNTQYDSTARAFRQAARAIDKILKPLEAVSGASTSDPGESPG